MLKAKTNKFRTQPITNCKTDVFSLSSFEMIVSRPSLVEERFESSIDPIEDGFFMGKKP